MTGRKVETGSVVSRAELDRLLAAEAPLPGARPRPARFEAAERAGIPPRFRALIKPDASRIAALAEGRNLYVVGPVGTGKTFSACSTLLAWVQSGRSGLYAPVLGLLTRLGDAMRDGTEGEVVARHSRVGLLVLDDLGKEAPTEWALSRLFEILDGRYAAGLPTVVTTQYEPPDLARHLASRDNPETTRAIVSRLVGEGAVVERHDGRDRRTG